MTTSMTIIEYDLMNDYVYIQVVKCMTMMTLTMFPSFSTHMIMTTYSRMRTMTKHDNGGHQSTGKGLTRLRWPPSRCR